MSKTTCIVPWSNIVLGPDGRASFCCDIPDPLTVEGRQGSVYRDSLDDLWNAPELVQVRAAMARGERPKSCHLCWEREAAGGVSRRLVMNAAYRRIGGRLAVEDLTREGAATGYRLERRPDWYILELGNVCNLKCRSCSPLFSSRIAADRVHAAWAGNEVTPAFETTPARPLRLVPEKTSAWFQDIDRLADMIASGAGDNAMLSLIGGEPFLIDSTWQLLSALVARGVAPRVFVGLQTNGQQRSSKLEGLVPHFRGFHVQLSIDGHGKLFEYLRYGGSWRKLLENLDWLHQVPNLGVNALPTLQNANALDMVTLLRFLDEQELPLGYNAVNWPERLSATNLPPSVRRIATERLRQYLDAECKPINQAIVRGYCEILEAAGDSFDAGLFDEFMTFTNDLDADRGESLRDVAPELVALVRAAGIDWSDERRHTVSGAAPSTLRSAEVLQRMNRTVVSGDTIFAAFEAVQPGLYFSSGASLLVELDGCLRETGQRGLAGSGAVADFGCHYGRITRALRAALPHAAIYACDIDRRAVQFCANELGAIPVVTGWQPDDESLPNNLDAVISISLLTHTPLEHWRRVLRAWARMLRPGGAAAFTFLSERHVDPWLAGEMENYGSYSPEQRADTIRAVREGGFGFAALTSGYGGEPFYGIAFAMLEVVRREITAAGLELLGLPAKVSTAIGQDLALVRKPEEQSAPRAAAPAVLRDVSLVAFYDARGYAPAEGGEGNRVESLWARLVAAQPPRPLPTELGFGDPRVPEVREAQASLAREHGVDGFCYLYFWRAAGPRWDAPWRDLVATGRPDFPFCLMVTVEDDVPLSAVAAGRLFEDIAPGLQDLRYLRVEGRHLLVVRDVGRLIEPRAIAAQWRAAAEARGLGELHLCAAEPVAADCPQDLGFDSFLEAPAFATDYAGVVAAALARPWPGHRLFRAVQCRRDTPDSHSGALYEHWLRSAFDETRRSGEGLVFVDGWNDWLRGRYLEPDERDGRAALLATRRASRGPASGQVLLRQLRDALGQVEGPAAAVLAELEQVVALHEHTRDRLLASIEVALGRSRVPGPETQHWVPVASRNLPPSPGRFALDVVGILGATELRAAQGPIPLRGNEVRLAGWAHTGNCAPGEVDLFLALESSTGAGDLIFRVAGRAIREDVAAALPDHPANCGFDTIIKLSGLPPGTYQVAIVQRTPSSAYRDATGVSVRRDEAPCSSV
jgi:MoaA/NifB/PqqE/SkfB family radical SAM enzyme/SAM-dependent methyltransferase